LAGDADVARLQRAYLAIEGILKSQTGGAWERDHGGARQVSTHAIAPRVLRTACGW